MGEHRRGLRALVLMLVSFTSLGPNGAHEMYNVLQPSMTKPSSKSNATSADFCPDCLGMGDDNYNIMFTIMFWSSTIALTVTGLLLDKLGNSVIVPILLLVSAGASLVAVGGGVSGTSAFLPTAFAGSALLGLGYLPSIVARDRIVSMWFSGQEIGVAFGAVSCVNRLASLIAFAGTEPLRLAISLQSVLWVTAFCCFVSLLCGLTVAVLDAWRDSRAVGDGDGDGERAGPPRLRDLLNLGLEYWLLLAINALVFTAHNTMQDNLTEFVHDTDKRTKFASALIGGSVHYIGILAAPVSGVIVHRIGRSSFLIAAASLVLAPAVGLLAFTSLPQLPVIILIGTCTCFLYVSVIGSVTLVIPRQAMGTALACCFCAATMFAGIVHAAVAKILGWEYDLPAQVKAARWRSVLSVVLCLCLLMLATSLLLLCVSVQRRSPLSTSEKAAANNSVSIRYQNLPQEEESNSE